MAVVEVDCSGSSRPVWLVKVPKYLDNVWSKADESGVVGSLMISKNSKNEEVIFKLSDELVKSTAEQSQTPNEHRLIMSKVEQSQAVFSETRPESIEKASEKEDAERETKATTTGDICLEGVVMQRGDCRPVVTSQYMNLKKQSILSSRAPSRQARHLNEIVTTIFKPVLKHKADEEHEKKKKQDGKRARADTEHVLEMLFKAFERHQYYYMKDLIRITEQPMEHLKEILKNYCIYNKKNPHKNMWELKPEYRHYEKKESP